MANLIVIAILLLIIGLAVGYIVKSKKSGVKCIGCPSGCNCSAGKGQGGCACSGCHTGSEE